MHADDERALTAEADQRAARYLATLADRRVFPSEDGLAGLAALGGDLPEDPSDALAVLGLLDGAGTPGTVTSNGPNYFGFVVGATLPVAAAAERLALTWDQCASARVNSPTLDAVEKAAGAWLLDVLDLPRHASVGFGTSATACGLACLAAAQTHLLERAGWDVAARGLRGAPPVRLVLPRTVHVTVLKAARLLGFGTDDLVFAETDACGRLDAARLPSLDDLTILCLQAGEVNTGEFDDFASLIPRARAVGAWVHVDGAFGLWARASSAKRPLADGAELADSWTTDGHKTLNTPYDGAAAICAHPELMARTMNAEAVYAPSEPDAQKNLTLEFSRRARGLGFWSVLRTLGRSGVETLVDRHCAHARAVAAGCERLGIDVLNRVVFNQVLCRLGDDDATKRVLAHVQGRGRVWFGPSVWEGRPAFRISVSSWRTDEAAIGLLLEELALALREVG